ncbi:hypothetical protein AD929_15625 [Gluconobacter potus]|uniref:Phage protein n=1 Tax=Gluconobacter potus TaxID=2724927 RepID=A0A149QPI7_9PROT|nr:hypothetical protein [Gluconobacter potus]KXU99227.1 hypothetical protein AD929_15625 [Gluconobacter potus]
MSLTSIEAAIGAVGRLSSAAPVVIGSVTLTGAEVPDSLRVGGQQRLVIHQLLGGSRVVDATGNDPARLTLSGRFLGVNALSRAQALEALRVAGKAITFSGAGLSAQVKIAEYWYDYTLKGAVIPYSIQLERSSVTTASSTSTSALSSLIGSDAADALTSVSDAVSSVTSTIDDFSSEIGTVVGQITPLATLVGAGGGLADVNDALSGVSGITGAVTNLAAAPSSVASLASSFTSATTTLSTVASQAGANLSAITFDGAGSLTTLAQNARIASTSVDGLASVTRAATNTQIAAGTLS